MDEKGSTRNGDKRPDLKPYRTSLDLMFALIVVILCSEFLAMVFLFFIRTFPPAVPMGLDPALLTTVLHIVLLSSLLYFFVFRPLLAFMKDLSGTELERIPGPFRSPRRMLWALILSVFIAEILVLLVMRFLSGGVSNIFGGGRETAPETGLIHPSVLIVLDPALLLLILFPVLYFLILKPLTDIVEQRRPAQAWEERGVRPFRSPLFLVILLGLMIFTVEALIMGLLVFVPHENPLVHGLMDSTLLLFLLLPSLYLIVFRPLLTAIEERREAELAALREKARFQRYLETAGIIVLVLDKEGKVQLINRRGCEILGYAEDEILGKKWIENFVPERVRDEISFVFRALLAGDTETAGYFENPVLTRQGGERMILWHNTVLTEKGMAVNTLSSGEDITERKLTEKALKESEARYRLVHNTAFDGIVISNSRDKIVDCNASAALIFGYTREELIGQEVSVIIPEKYKRLHKEGLRRFIETGVSKIQGRIAEYEGVRKNGETFPMELALNNFMLHGEVHFTGVVRDITDRKRAEREREIIQTRLSQSQKMEAIGRFAGGIAHDFNNILTAIRGNAELAIEDTGKDDPVYKKIDSIITSVLLASKLTRQLLLFSRGQRFELVPLNINKLVEDLLLMISRIIGESIMISTELDPELWIIEADEGNIEQVIMNLAVNARDAMPEGGRLTIRTENIVIDDEQAKSIPDARPGEVVCLSVADTGTGIEKDLLPRIFEPFFTTKEAGKGTGFGLSIVYSIVKQHNGWITVSSEPGKGSTFRIYLPAKKQALAVTAERASRHIEGAGESILLVEDDRQVREFTRVALAEHGFRVVGAGNAKEAREALEREDGFRLLLSDVVLMDQSGFQLALDVLSRKPDTAVLLTSSYLEPSQRQTLESRGYRFLEKPYSMSGLLAEVREALNIGKEG